MFYYCPKLTSLDVSSWDTSKVTNMGYMFANCNALTSLDVSSWDTSQVTNMSCVFSSCNALTSLDVSSWDISKVINMNSMFYNCASLKTIYSSPSADWSKVSSSENMFFYYEGTPSKRLTIVGGKGTKYDTTKTDASYARVDGLNGKPGYFTAKTPKAMIAGAVTISGTTQAGNVLTANVSGTQQPSGLSYKWYRDDTLVTGATSKTYLLTAKDIGHTISCKVTNKSYRGYLKSLAVGPVSNPVMTGSVSISGTPESGSLLTASVVNAPSGAIVSYRWLRDGSPIEGATSSMYTLAEADIDHKTTCVVTAPGFSGSLVSNEIGPIANAVPKAFAVYSADDSSLNFYKRSSVPSAGEDFEGHVATAVYTGIETSDYKYVNPWQSYRSTIKSVSVIDEGIMPSSTKRWFSGLSSCTSFDLSKLDTSSVTDMSSMFFGCSALTVLDISNFNTSQVVDMSYLFASCSKLTALDLTNFDTSQVVNMKAMFQSCSSVTTIYAGNNWSSAKTDDSTNMFYNCLALVGGNGTTFDSTKINKAYAHIDGGTSNPGYFTDKNAPVKTEVEKQLESMTLHEKVCQMFCVYPEDLGGSGALTVAGSTQQKTLQSYPYGGVCYFLQNIKSESQAKTLVSTIESYSEVPMFHAVDEEGGRVQRIGGTTYSGAKRGAGIGNQLNAMYTYKDLGTDTAYSNAQLLAANLNRLGMNWDFAPVADVNSNPSNPVIGDRAYGDDFDATGELVASAVRGFNDAGVATALKHFPGHGDTATDSHTGAASVSKTLDQLRNEEFKSFKAGIAAGADSVMMGHLMIEGAKESVPTSCSYEFVTEVLRNELGFDGVITTDGMGMGAITKVYGTTKQGHIDAVMACLNAGIDVFLLPGDPAACVDAIEAAIANGEVSEERIDASVKRILTLKEKIAANESKRNAATLQAMHAAAVADEELTKAATKATSVEPTVSVEANAESVAVGNKVMLSATTEGIDETDHLSYQWYISANVDMADKAPIENATQAQIEYTMQDPGSWYIQCEVTYREESILSKPVAIKAYTPEGGQ